MLHKSQKSKLLHLKLANKSVDLIKYRVRIVLFTDVRRAVTRTVLKFAGTVSFANEK